MGQRRSAALRVALGLLAAGSVVGYAGVAGANEQPAEHLIKAVPGTVWDKPALTIATGDRVTWDIDSGDGQFHNAEGETGPAADPAWPVTVMVPIERTGRGSYTFTQPGAYEYVCLVHAGSMRGVVTVTGAPVTPTATPSATATASPTRTPTATPTATATATATASATPSPRSGATPTPLPTSMDRDTPAPRGTARADRTAPAITALKARTRTGGAKVSFKLSESASVTLRIKRGKRTLKTVRGSFRAGSGSVTLRRMARGTYRVTIEARDARGNKAAVQTTSVKVKRA